MNKLFIVSDVDGVLADFTDGIINEANKLGFGNFFPSSPSDVSSWNICDKFLEVFDYVKYRDAFWLNLPVLNKINFTPLAYLTARPCDSKVTKKWLEKMNSLKQKL